MAASMLDLWPEDISVDTLSPLAILKMQASFLEQRTGGLLRGDAIRVEAVGTVSYLFNVVAPGLSYTERVLVVTHEAGRYYPAVVKAAGFAPDLFNDRDSDELDEKTGLRPSEKRACTDKEFIGLIREALRSADVRGLISSLLADINEKQQAAKAAG